MRIKNSKYIFEIKNKKLYLYDMQGNELSKVQITRYEYALCWRNLHCYAEKCIDKYIKEQWCEFKKPARGNNPMGHRTGATIDRLREEFNNLDNIKALQSLKTDKKVIAKFEVLRIKAQIKQKENNILKIAEDISKLQEELIKNMKRGG